MSRVLIPSLDEPTTVPNAQQDLRELATAWMLEGVDPRQAEAALHEMAALYSLVECDRTADQILDLQASACAAAFAEDAECRLAPNHTVELSDEGWLRLMADVMGAPAIHAA